MGDMNEVLSSNEVSGGAFSVTPVILLSNMMANCDFIDMDTVGGFYTWRKNVTNGGHVRKRLERCMANIDWCLLFPMLLWKFWLPIILIITP